MTLENLDQRSLKHALEDMDYDLINLKMKTLSMLHIDLPRRLGRLSMLKAIRAPREIIDGEQRIALKMMWRFTRLAKWAQSPANDDFVETMIVGEAEEAIR